MPLPDFTRDPSYVTFSGFFVSITKPSAIWSRVKKMRQDPVASFLSYNTCPFCGSHGADRNWGDHIERRPDCKLASVHEL